MASRSKIHWYWKFVSTYSDYKKIPTTSKFQYLRKGSNVVRGSEKETTEKEITDNKGKLINHLNLISPVRASHLQPLELKL